MDLRYSSDSTQRVLAIELLVSGKVNRLSLMSKFSEAYNTLHGGGILVTLLANMSEHIEVKQETKQRIVWQDGRQSLMRHRWMPC